LIWQLTKDEPQNQGGQALARHVRVKALVRLGDENLAARQEKPDRSRGFGKVAAAPAPSCESGAMGQEHREKFEMARMPDYPREQGSELERSTGAASKLFGATR